MQVANLPLVRPGLPRSALILPCRAPELVLGLSPSREACVPQPALTFRPSPEHGTHRAALWCWRTDPLVQLAPPLNCECQTENSASKPSVLSPSRGIIPGSAS